MFSSSSFLVKASVLFVFCVTLLFLDFILVLDSDSPPKEPVTATEFRRGELVGLSREVFNSRKCNLWCNPPPSGVRVIHVMSWMTTANAELVSKRFPYITKTFTSRDLDIMKCVGIFRPVFPERNNSKVWDERVQWHLDLHPALFPMHGAVSPHRLLRQAVMLAHLLRTDSELPEVPYDFEHLPRTMNSVMASEDLRFPHRGQKPVVIVELGCGNGGLLSIMCPPKETVACFGTDISPVAIEHGKKFLPHIDLRVMTSAPHVPNRAASAVLSHGVMYILTPHQACKHIEEALRLLRPGGVAVFWALRVGAFGTRYHPSFFRDGEDGAPVQFLSQCAHLHELVDDVLIITTLSDAPIYPPDLNRTGWFAVRITRNDAKYDAADPDSVADIPFGEETEANRLRGSMSQFANFIRSVDRLKYPDRQGHGRWIDAPRKKKKK